MGLARNLYHPDELLDKAAAVFLSRSRYDVAAAILSFLVTRQPKHWMAWFGIGHSLMCLAQHDNNFDYLDSTRLATAVSCFKRSLAENNDYQVAREAIETIATKSPFSQQTIEGFPPYSGDSEVLRNLVNFSPEKLVKTVRDLPDWHDRMTVVMCLGEQAEHFYLPLLIDVIDNDPHGDVTIGAVKRLVFYPDYPETQACMERLVHSGRWRDIAPYVSMTLNRLRLPWAQTLLNLIAEVGEPEWTKIPVPRQGTRVNIYVASDDKIEDFVSHVETVLGVRHQQPPHLTESLGYLYTLSSTDPHRLFSIRQTTPSNEDSDLAQYAYTIRIWATDAASPQPLAAARHFARFIFDKLKATGQYRLLMIDDINSKLGQFEPTR